MKVLALDFGAARTGVAVSDATGTIARPLGVVEALRPPDGLRGAAEIVREHGRERVVVGLPLTLRGEHGSQAHETQEFVRRAARCSSRFRSRRYDERFTTALAAARGSGRTRTRARPRICSRAICTVSRHERAADARRCASCWPCSCSRAAWHDEPPRRTVETTPPLARLRIIFPEGFTRREMADRVDAVREIAIRQARRHAAADDDRVPRGERSGRAARGVSQGLDAAARSRASCSRRRTSSPSSRPPGGSCATSSRVPPSMAKVDLRYARSKNLTPYDVLIIASMIEKETVAPEERRLVAAVIYNRLRNGMPLGIDATHPLRTRRARDGAPQAVRPRERQPVQHAHSGWGSHRRRSRTRAWPRCARRRIQPVWTTCTSSASRDSNASLLHGERVRVLPEILEYGYGGC